MNYKDIIYNVSISNDELLEIIINKVKNKTPASIIRKSDGENIIIGYGSVKGIKLKKYIKKLRHFNISYFTYNKPNYYRLYIFHFFLKLMVYIKYLTLSNHYLQEFKIELLDVIY